MKEKDFRYVGKSISNDQAVGKVTGRVEYCSDLNSVGMLHLRCKAGTISHGILTRVDTSEAEKLPGVRAIYTMYNTPDKYYDRGRVSNIELAGSANQEKLFDSHIRFYGERVAAVVAETVEIAQKACDLIQVEYEPLPLVLTMEEAMKEDAPQLHPTGNIYPSRDSVYRDGFGDYESAEGELVFRTESHIGRMTHLSMETQSVRAKYERGSGKLTVWSGTQTVYGIRSTVADYLEMPYSKVRVIKAVMGGSFGCKQEMLLEPLVAYAARDLEADVKCVFTREEQIVNTMLKHNLDGYVESKVNKDGEIQGLKVHIDMEAGAHQTITPSYLRTAGGKLAKSYRLKNVEFTGRTFCTTTPVNGSFRSWGSSEAAIVQEPHWNYVADQLGMDPIDFRLKNVMEPYDMERMHNANIGNARFRDVLIQGRERFNWDERKKECKEKNAQKGRYRYGVGVALCSHARFSRDLKDRLNSWDFEVYYGIYGEDVAKKKQGINTYVHNSTYLTLPESKAFIEKHKDHIYLVPCNCKCMMDVTEKPRNVCLNFNSGDNSPWDRGHGTEITAERAWELILDWNKRGLMQNGEDYAICNCDGASCYPLQMARKAGSRGMYPTSNYTICWNEEECINCGKCASICNFQAFKKGEDKKVSFDPELCWGCTICSANCPKGAITLKKKTND